MVQKCPDTSHFVLVGPKVSVDVTPCFGLQVQKYPITSHIVLSDQKYSMTFHPF